MHSEILAYLRRVSSRLPGDLDVVEVGSMVMHGSPREVFEQRSRSYVGIDWRSGPGVDVVGLAHEALRGREADLVVWCQAIEHDPLWRETLRASVEALSARGGWLVATWAGPGYPEHELDTAPPDPENPSRPYYAPRSVEEVEAVLRTCVPRERLELVETAYERGTLDALLLARLVPPLDG